MPETERWQAAALKRFSAQSGTETEGHPSRLKPLRPPVRRDAAKSRNLPLVMKDKRRRQLQ